MAESRWRARRTVVLLIAGVVLAGSAPRRVSAQENPDQDLIEQLRADDFDARQTATDKLRSMGETARPLLIKAMASDDPDIRQVASQLLANLKKSIVKVQAFDRDGKPAGNAEADARYSDARQQPNGGEDTTQAVVLDKEGTASLILQPVNPVNFYLNWKAWTATGTQPVTWPISFNTGTTPLIYTLAKYGTVSVRVNTPDGKPLKDAHVSLYNGMRLDPELLELQLVRLGQQLQHTAATNEQGVAKLEDVPEGVYQVVVRADNYLSTLLPNTRVREGAASDGGAATLIPGSPGKIQFTFKRAEGGSAKGKQLDYTLDPVLEGPRAAELRRTLGIIHQWNGRNRQQTPAGDENSKFTIENVTPGKYELTFRCEQKASQHFGPIEVKSGATLDLGEVKEVSGGNVNGKVTAPGGGSPGYVYITAVPEQEVIDAVVDSSMPDWRYTRQDSLSMQRVNAQNNGSYELKELAPGRYTLCLVAQTGAAAYVFGMDVTSGKTIQAPDVELGIAGKSLEIKGHVTLSDGKPAVGAAVWLTLASQNSWSATCDAEGAFKMVTPSNYYGDPISLGVRLAGHKPRVIDLVHGNVKLDAVDIRLEKQDYGSIRVKIVDEEGKPLAGASVYPATRAGTAPTRRSNGDGFIDLTGLATGTRTLMVDCEGYFVHEPKVVVDADRENQSTIVMHKGFVLNGRVKFPAGTPPDALAVALTGPVTLSVPVDAEGRFKCEGLKPGEYTVVGMGPALVQRDPEHVVLKPDQTEVPEVKLELAHASGVALNLGAAYEGYTVSLLRGNTDASTTDPRFIFDRALMNSTGISSTVDATGRAEFWGAAAGSYDLRIIPPQRTYNYYGRTTKLGSINRAVRDITVPELKSFSELKTMPAIEVKLEPGTGSISGRLVLDHPPSGMAMNGNLMLSLSGPAFSAINYVFPQEFRATVGKVAFLGTVPAGLKAPEQGQFTVKNLPAGEYTLKVELNSYRTRSVRTGRNSWYNTMLPDSDKPAPQTVKTFTLKEGEQLDLGAVTFTVPQETPEAAARTEEQGVEDQMPSFQP